MLKKFNELSKIVRFILLVVPFVNWVVEMVIRWSLFLEKKDTGSLLVALIATFFFGNILGIVDAVFTLIQDKMVLLDLKL